MPPPAVTGKRGSWLQRSQNYAGVIAIIAALTGLTGAATGVVGLVIASNASNEAAREDQATSAAAARAYARNVSYTPQVGRHSAPELVISNPGDGLLTHVLIRIPCNTDCPAPTLLRALADIPHCASETFTVAQLTAGDGELPPNSLREAAAESDLYFTDPTGHSWRLAAESGELAKPGAPQSQVVDQFVFSPIPRHIPGCV